VGREPVERSKHKNTGGEEEKDARIAMLWLRKVGGSKAWRLNAHELQTQHEEFLFFEVRGRERGAPRRKREGGENASNGDSLSSENRAREIGVCHTEIPERGRAEALRDYSGRSL